MRKQHCNSKAIEAKKNKIIQLLADGWEVLRMMNELASEVNSCKKAARSTSHAVEKAKTIAANYLEKMKEFSQCWLWLRDEIVPKKEHVIKMKDSILEYQMIIDEMKEEHEGTIHTLTQVGIQK